MALTGSNRGDRHNRDMLIDSSLLGVDGTAELIESLARKVIENKSKTEAGTKTQSATKAVIETKAGTKAGAEAGGDK